MARSLKLSTAPSGSFDYDWFTEGVDTADLKDAKARLDQLSN